MKVIFSSLITVTLLFFSQCEAQHGIRVKKIEKLPLLFGNWKEDTNNQEGFEKLTNELKYLYPVGSNPSEMKIVYLEKLEHMQSLDMPTELWNNRANILYGQFVDISQIQCQKRVPV
nr:uncharacterized protein LOC121123157 isoform X1 [Lepeophtheirus salmonis]